MLPMPLPSGMPPLQAMQLDLPVINSFWNVENLHEHMINLRETTNLLKAMQKELELLITSPTHDNANEVLYHDKFLEDISRPSPGDSESQSFKSSGSNIHSYFLEMIEESGVTLGFQESLSLEAANSLLSTLKNQLAPLNALTGQPTSWEEKSMAVRFTQKLQKSRRNKHWKKRKRRHAAEMLQKERQDYDKADKDADNWRIREIAKGIAKRKVQDMRIIAKRKANEGKKRLEEELELILMVEKLQELHNIRIQKLKKQGHFLPEEDDKFLERVRAAVEEEERLAAAAADTDAAKGAIATVEESRKAIHDLNAKMKDTSRESEQTKNRDLSGVPGGEKSLVTSGSVQSEEQVDGEQAGAANYDFVANLPPEFYHYYHGGSNDMGTLIEVRRVWDAYIRPRGSRIPGHWVRPPPPANDIWASYLGKRS